MRGKNKGTPLRRLWAIRGHVVVLVGLAVATLLASNATAQAGRISHNTPSYVSTAKKLGTEDPSKTMEVSIWLNVHNRSELDALAEQLYDRTSPNYRQFLNHAQIAARYAPSAEEAKRSGNSLRRTT